MSQRKTFIESLFDISFNHYVAIKVIGILYIIAVALISLGCFVLLLGAFSSGGMNIIYGLIGTPLVWMLYVIMARIGLESLVASIKTSENTTQMLDIMRSKQNPY
jgi:hypothetical protein